MTPEEQFVIEGLVLRSYVSSCPELGPWPETEAEADARIAKERAAVVWERILALRASASVKAAPR